MRIYTLQALEPSTHWIHLSNFWISPFPSSFIFYTFLFLYFYVFCNIPMHLHTIYSSILPSTHVFFSTPFPHSLTSSLPFMSKTYWTGTFHRRSVGIHVGWPFRMIITVGTLSSTLLIGGILDSSLGWSAAFGYRSALCTLFKN